MRRNTGPYSPPGKSKSNKGLCDKGMGKDKGKSDKGCDKGKSDKGMGKSFEGKDVGKADDTSQDLDAMIAELIAIQSSPGFYGRGQGKGKEDYSKYDTNMFFILWCTTFYKYVSVMRK